MNISAWKSVAINCGMVSRKLICFNWGGGYFSLPGAAFRLALVLYPIKILVALPSPCLRYFVVFSTNEYQDSTLKYASTTLFQVCSFSFYCWDEVKLSLLVIRPEMTFCTSPGWQMIERSIWWNKNWQGNWSTLREPTPLSLFPPQVPHILS
jgi:hypothetical protein